MFSGFFPDPPDQREKNLSWLVISALSFLQPPESWSEGQHGATGAKRPATALQLSPPPQPPAVPLACSRDA